MNTEESNNKEIDSLDSTAASSDPITEPEKIIDEPQKSQSKVRPAGMWISLVSFFVAVLAWIELVFNEYASMVLGIVGLIGAIVGCCMTRRSFWRDLSITSIIITGVLLLIFSLFFFGLRFAINSL